MAQTYCAILSVSTHTFILGMCSGKLHCAPLGCFSGVPGNTPITTADYLLKTISLPFSPCLFILHKPVKTTTKKTLLGKKREGDPPWDEPAGSCHTHRASGSWLPAEVACLSRRGLRPPFSPQEPYFRLLSHFQIKRPVKEV